ncbi:hypothetical protein Pcinc_024313, partial [Petrolisthes cinctipes]
MRQEKRTRERDEERDEERGREKPVQGKEEGREMMGEGGKEGCKEREEWHEERAAVGVGACLVDPAVRAWDLKVKEAVIREIRAIMQQKIKSSLSIKLEVLEMFYLTFLSRTSEDRVWQGRQGKFGGDRVSLGRQGKFGETGYSTREGTCVKYGPITRLRQPHQHHGA